RSPIFRSRKATNGGRLHRVSVTHLVKEAAKRAGISEKTSAHWLRHCYASHALNRGAPIHLRASNFGPCQCCDYQQVSSRKTK
ncbi:tyrosine-type recombinase/integrase, partial [Microcoleus sp. herbarium2]|uniref:tyrosine-type recombinase/integrase n=1 Tax=Microcoleus sp. herbarium2 TaxID=3055433 RepID=UPI002FD113DB